MGIFKSLKKACYDCICCISKPFLGNYPWFLFKLQIDKLILLILITFVTEAS